MIIFRLFKQLFKYFYNFKIQIHTMKNLIYIFTFVLATTAIAQNTTTLAFEKQKLQMAKAYSDEAMITSSMYNIITLEGPNSTYKDSLAYVYFNKRNYVSCYLVLIDLLEKNPENIELLEMSAVSLESMGALDKSKEAYEKLLEKSKDNFHAYKLAGLQFRMNKGEDAYTAIKKADALPDKGTINVTFQVNKNYNQNIALKAAISYLEGIIAESLGKPIEAKVCYERAVQLSPDFVLAKSKLEIIKAKEAEEKEN